MKKRIILLVIIIAILLILLFPITFHLNDGGSIEFKALLYTVTKYHKLNENTQNGYLEGIGIEILGIEVYNNINKQLIKSENNKKLEDNQQNQTIPTTQNDNSFVGTVLKETTTYMIVEPNEDEEERKTADKIQINYGTDHKDYLYGVGRKVIINYAGYIKETYPAQIDTNNILIDGYEKFELTVKESKNENKTKIINNKKLYKNNTDYNLYYYGIEEVNITINNKIMSLKDALISGKMTIDGLIIKANEDIPNATVYKDGGSIEYHYDNYTIIKMHTMDGNRDVYIGTKDMTINHIK